MNTAIPVSDSYKELSELYARRKEEHARAMGALESYKQQKERAHVALQNAIYELGQAAEQCSDLQLAEQARRLVQMGNQLQLDPQHVSSFSAEVNALCVAIENKLKELLA